MLKSLKETSLANYKVGSREYFTAQKQLILSRPLLKWCYDQWYEHLLADARSVPRQGTLLELGSGGSYLKDLKPSVITSDVVAGVADQVVDGRSLPFPDGSVQALFLTHVFHHIPDVGEFLREAQRALVPGGVISMIEVAHTPFARFFFRNFHPEPYRDDPAEWPFAQQDSMMDSNQALSWMVFVRDRRKFEQLYPGLKIETLGFLPWFSYLLAGGVTGRCLVPRSLTGLVRFAEPVMRLCAPIFSLHWHIRVRKVATS
ncbi:MAG: methyltransferase type 11 [Pedosphaera sp.]|nr:methyltransferase type 11 [Pedosphaera sp.]